MTLESTDRVADGSCHFQNSSILKLKLTVLFVVLNRCIDYIIAKVLII